MALTKSSALTELADDFTYDVSFDAAHVAPLVAMIPGVEPTGTLSVRFTEPTMFEAIRCFRALTRVASSGVEPSYG